VIDFEDMSAERARQWPDLFALLENKARSERAKQSRKHLRERWWQHAEVRPALRRAITLAERVLVIPRVAGHAGLVFFAESHDLFRTTNNICSIERRCILRSAVAGP
jgi:hypothetical protein